LGQIIIASLHPDLLDRIRVFCHEKGIPAGMLENISLGLNHAEIGAMVAQKWNFPEQLVASIRHHHTPTECNPESWDVVISVYLANAITDLERDRINYEQIHPRVLKDYGIETEEQLLRIQQRLENAFLDQRSKF
jgi:HD-like signal output (HDOD) protein